VSKTVCLLPAPNATGAGGVMMHVKKLAEHLERRGWEVIAQPDTFGKVTTVTVRIYPPSGSDVHAREVTYRFTVDQ
jgi:hypothetical protein